MPPVATTSWTHLQALASQLGVFDGHRTLWLDEERNLVVHAEPDDDLEEEGLLYIDTVMKPDAEDLAIILGVIPTSEPEHRPFALPEPPPGMAAALAS